MPVAKRNGLPMWRKPGVYSIVCNVTGRVYVGSSLAVRGRLNAHRSCLRRGVHDNPILQAAWVKYGETAFRFEVLEVCPAEVLPVRELAWMTQLNATDGRYGFNIALVPGTVMTGRKHSDEQKAKWSADRKGIAPKAATEAAAVVNRGKKRPPEVVEKIRRSHKGKPKSEAHKAAISATHWTKRLSPEERSRRMREIGRKGLDVRYK